MKISTHIDKLFLVILAILLILPISHINREEKLKQENRMLAFIVGWVMFRAVDMTHATKYIRVMFGMKHSDMIYKVSYFIGTYEIFIFAVAILCAMPIFKNIVKIDDNRRPLPRLAVNTYLVCLFILSVSAIAASTYNPFIYFRF